MFIQTEAMPDPCRMKFFPGESVLMSGAIEILNSIDAQKSPLASRIFDIQGVSSLVLYEDSIAVTKNENSDWQILKPMILGSIMDHFSSGDDVLLESSEVSSDENFEFNIEDSPEDSEIIDQIDEIMQTRIKPAAEQMGGDVLYKAFKDGILFVEFVGPTMALINGMTNVISHYVPGVKSVKDFRDAIAKPGLNTPDGIAIQNLLNDKINPSVASHGGYISLIDVRDSKAYIRLEGGCQGCGMADVTLKQGVEVEIKAAVPSITAVLDVTDHAGGNNPYYSA